MKNEPKDEELKSKLKHAIAVLSQFEIELAKRRAKQNLKALTP